MEANEMIILVNNNDKSVGTMEKMETHIKGKLHRAFSIFIFNDKGEMLLQRRSLNKYHSGGLWTNTCCSHPREKETLEEATKRRLYEEVGIETKLDKVFSFLYYAELDKGLIEHEYDHVFFGYSNDEPRLNLEEVMDYRWMSLEKIEEDMKNNNKDYTYWFKEVFYRVVDKVRSN